MPTETVTGPMLRKERRDANVHATEVARRAGWTRNWVHGVEALAAPKPEQVARHRAAVKAAVEAAGGS